MNNYKGFTLVEMMVTLAIAGVLMAVAIPASRDFQANMRVTTVANNLVTTLKTARTQAIVKKHNMLMMSANTSAPASNNWGGKGWLINEVSVATVTIFEQHNIPTATTIQSIPTLASFRFEGITGMAQNNDAAGTMLAGGSITFRVCDTGSPNERGRDILVNQFGRIFMTTHANTTICNP